MRSIRCLQQSSSSISRRALAPGSGEETDTSVWRLTNLKDVLIVLLLVVTMARQAAGADNTLTEQEKAAGWQLLFDGTDPSGWVTSNGSPIEPAADQGNLNPRNCRTYMIATKEKYENFILKLDFKLSKDCNSGVFFRVFSLEPLPDVGDVGWNGLEIAVQDGANTGYHDMGALYDLVRPTHNALKPLGEWNHLELTCDKNMIMIVLNGSLVTWMDTNQWTQPKQRPNGTGHKFDWIYQHFPRSGHIGLQDHGHDVWYKNIKIRKLPTGVRSGEQLGDH